MRVLIFAPTVGRGGVHRVVETLTSAFARLQSPELSFSILGQPLDENALPIRWPSAPTSGGGIPFEDIGAPLDPHPYLFDQLMHKAGPLFLSALHHRLAREKFDLVFCPSAWWCMNVPLWFLPVPFVTCVPDFAFDDTEMTGWLADYFRRSAHLIAQRADLTIFSSEYQRQKGVRDYGFTKTTVIRHCADFVAPNFDITPEAIEATRNEFRLPDVYALAFHCAYHKDPLTILHGHRQAQQMCPDVPPLVIAGLHSQDFIPGARTDNSHFQTVQREIVKLGYTLGQDLLILGEVPDRAIGPLTAGASMSLVASRSEGDLSGSMYEAFAAKTPLIYSDFPVFTENLGDGEYGLCFPRGDHKLLAHRIAEVTQYPEDAKMRAEAAYMWARKRTADDVANEFVSAFRSAL